MRGARGRTLAAAALSAVVLVVLAGVASAEVPKPEKPPTFTADELEARLWKGLPSAVALVLLRFVVAAGGLTLLILEFSRGRAVARGLLPRPPVPPPPPPLLSGGPGGAGMSLVGTLGLLLVAFALPGIAHAGLARAVPDWTPLARQLVATAVPTLLLAGLVLARRARTLRDPGPPAAPAGEALAQAGRSFCVASVFLVPAGVLSNLVVRRLGLPDAPQELIGTVVEGGTIDALLVAGFGVLVAPFTEECLFRGLLYPQVRALLRRFLACTATALAFAAIHANWVALLPLTVLAWFLCDLYERTRSIVAVVSMHAAFNASSLVPLLLLRDA